MHYVYLIESVHDRNRRYIGQTGDLRSRLLDHNSGRSIHTARFRPWHLICYVAFPGEQKAVAFEEYLKSGSGKAFALRHLLQADRWVDAGFRLVCTHPAGVTAAVRPLGRMV